MLFLIYRREEIYIMIEVEKISDNNFEVIVCDKLKGILSKDEMERLFFDLAEKLDYDVRSKW